VVLTTVIKGDHFTLWKRFMPILQRLTQIGHQKRGNVLVFRLSKKE